MNIKLFGSQSSFTYILGKTLYIPLTSKSNCCTLPETRGPGFALPRLVVSSLLRVRDVERIDTRNRAAVGLDVEFRSIMEKNDGTAPPKNSDHDEKVLLPKWNGAVKLPSNPLLNDEQLYPTIDMIMDEVKHYARAKSMPRSIAFAGEGEPTLRLNTLMALSEQIKAEFTNLDDAITIRIVTNGLVLAGLDESRRVLQKLKAKGIDELSIALMTSCPEQYFDLMQPYYSEMNVVDKKAIHCKLCQLIHDAVEEGFHVECTGVEHKFVDKILAEQLASQLGAHRFRWRSYFP